MNHRGTEDTELNPALRPLRVRGDKGSAPPDEDAADLAIINANAAELNAEAEDALSYQVPLWGAAPRGLNPRDILMRDDDHD